MSRDLVIRNARIVFPDGVVGDRYIVVRNGVIREIGVEPYHGYSDSLYIDAEGLLVSPGFIDTHIHGCCGFDACSSSPDDILYLASELTRYGVTGFLPTSVSLPHEKLIEISKAVYSAYSKWSPENGARILGLHLEGPYINPVMKGAQNIEYIREASISELREYISASHGLVRKITVAPEVDGCLDLISYAVGNNVVVGIGHTSGSYEVVKEAIRRGASIGIHLYNAMKDIHHRDPGPTLALLDDKNVFLELIIDNVHLSKHIARFTIDYAGFDRVVLVTDSISVAGLPDGVYELCGLAIVVEKGIARVKGSNVLAGSTLSMDKAVKNTIDLGYRIEEAITMATAKPAKSINAYYIEKIGAIKPGYKADIIILDKEINIYKTIVDGNIVYEKQ